MRGLIDWFGELSPPLRYVAFTVAAFLAFFVAAGVGATTALVLGTGDRAPSEIGSGGPADSETPEATTVEATSDPGTPQEPTSETTNSTENTDPEETNSEEPNSEETESEEVVFVHRATDGNSRGDYTYISSPTIDGDSNAVVIARPTQDGESAASALAIYGHNTGVWYEPQRREWAIFNQDRAAVAAGSTFQVTIPSEDEGFIHFATPDNTTEDTTYLDDPLTNGNPDAAVSVTQNWNPGGGRGVYNNHPVGVRYDEDEEQWTVFNRDSAPIPDGSAYNIAVSGTAS